jgi:hypothetical protein
MKFSLHLLNITVEISQPLKRDAGQPKVELAITPTVKVVGNVLGRTVGFSLLRHCEPRCNRGVAITTVRLQLSRTPRRITG